MRPTIVVVFVLTMIAPPASAQMMFCDRPSRPYFLPNGYSASFNEMQNAEWEIDRYLDRMRDYIECLADEVDDADAERSRVLRDWNYEVDAFNSR